MRIDLDIHLEASVNKRAEDSHLDAGSQLDFIFGAPAKLRTERADTWLFATNEQSAAPTMRNDISSHPPMRFTV